MRVRQYAYLSIKSDSLTPSEISIRLGVEADRSKIRGSREPGPPPLPRAHSWCLDSGVSHEADLGAHLDALLPRIAALRDRLPGVLGGSSTVGTLEIVRNFEEGDEDFDEATHGVAVPGMRRLSGQHPFLGWHLTGEQVQLIGSLGLSLDVDEYG